MPASKLSQKSKSKLVKPSSKKAKAPKSRVAPKSSKKTLKTSKPKASSRPRASAQPTKAAPASAFIVPVVKAIVAPTGPVKRRPPLNKKQLQELEGILLSDQRQHQRSSAGLEETLAADRENSDASGDIVDASGDVASMESATLLARHTFKAIVDIDSALRRMRQSPDFFGVCEMSGEPIPFERLLVMPTARTTAKHSRL